MTLPATILLLLGVGAAGLDWLAVAHEQKRLEYLCKPAALAFLVGAAATLDPTRPEQRWWFVAALALSLAGDVFLMLPQDLFVPGLASFLLAHVAYIVGFLTEVTMGRAALHLLLVLPITVLLAWRIVPAARKADPAVTIPVILYIAVITVMVGAALATHRVEPAIAAVLFMASDALIAWNRFVKPAKWMPLTIIVTYHLAQIGFVLSLTR